MRWIQGKYLLLASAIACVQCRVDKPIGPTTAGDFDVASSADGGLSDGADQTAGGDAIAPHQDIQFPDVSGPLCPGGPGCPCSGANLCTTGVCAGNPGACSDPCKMAQKLPEICNGVDDDCDGLTDVFASGANVCDDGNPCTADACKPGSGCNHNFNTSACDDGNACTTTDVCHKGACVGAVSLICDDKNPCTADFCTALSGCAHAANAVACEDGDPCTIGDVCAKSACTPGLPLGCVDDNPCTDDGCQKLIGCVFTDNSLPCNDGSACTVPDVCKDGACQGGSKLPCDDGNPCTWDSCDKTTACTHVANGLPCDDGEPCSYGDLCSGGKCTPGQPLPCHDGNACTYDSCGKDGCTFNNNSADCDDGNPCTSGDGCLLGQCGSGPPLNCSDNDACTLDTCDPKIGCIHSVSGQPCDDGNACTGSDQCSAGGCAGTQLVCSDGNGCTVDACDSQKGCFAVNNNDAACDDGSACTSADHCDGGACVGKAVDCNDNSPCTLDTCDFATGCKHTLFPDGSACGDIGICQGGLCSWGSDVRPATSCLQIHTTWPTAKTGTYWLDPDGAGSGTAYQVLCDMATDGGGWLRIDNFWANQLLVMDNPSPSQGKCQMSATEIRAWDGFDGAPGYGHLCMATRPSGNWMAYSALRFDGIVLTGYTPSKKDTYDLFDDCYSMQHLGAFCAGPNDALAPPYDTPAHLSQGQTVGPLNKLVQLGKVWTDFEIRAHEEGPQLEGIVWNQGAFLLR